MLSTFIHFYSSSNFISKNNIIVKIECVDKKIFKEKKNKQIFKNLSKERKRRIREQYLYKCRNLYERCLRTFFEMLLRYLVSQASSVLA